MISFEECINHFMDDHSFKFDKKTLKKHKLSMTQLLNFCEKPFHEITTRDIRSWILHLKEEDYKTYTVLSKLSGLRKFYEYCLEEGLLKTNPTSAVPLPKLEDKLPHYLTGEQMVQLRQLCKGNLKRRAAIELLYATGIRLSELLNMKLEDINWTERVIHIKNGKGKKERLVPFTKECGEHVKAFLQERKEQPGVPPYLFINRWGTGKMTAYGIQQWFIIYREKMNIHITPHTLRHTFAAHLAMKGMPLDYIQALLGHEEPKHTQVYARLHEQAQKQKYDEWM